MNRFDEVKKEAGRNIRSISILILSIILIMCNVSIAKLFNISEPRIIWALDFGIFNSLISILFSVIQYVINGYKLAVDVKLLNDRENLSEITVDSKGPQKIALEINLNGKSRKVSENLKILFPEWIDFQTKPQKYLEIDEENNICAVNLNHFIGNKKNVSLTKIITFDLVSTEEEKNKEHIEPELNMNLKDRLLSFSFNKSKLLIKNKK